MGWLGFLFPSPDGYFPLFFLHLKFVLGVSEKVNFRLRKDKFTSTFNVSGVLISLTFSGRDVSGDDVSVWVRVPDLVGMRGWEGRTRRKVVGFIYRVYMSVYDEVSFVLSPPTEFSDDEEKEIWEKIVSALTDPNFRGRLEIGFRKAHIFHSRVDELNIGVEDVILRAFGLKKFWSKGESLSDFRASGRDLVVQLGSSPSLTLHLDRFTEFDVTKVSFVYDLSFSFSLRVMFPLSGGAFDDRADRMLGVLEDMTRRFKSGGYSEVVKFLRGEVIRNERLYSNWLPYLGEEVYKFLSDDLRRMKIDHPEHTPELFRRWLSVRDKDFREVGDYSFVWVDEFPYFRGEDIKKLSMKDEREFLVSRRFVEERVIPLLREGRISEVFRRVFSYLVLRYGDDFIGWLSGRLGVHGDKVLGFVYDPSLVDISPFRLGGEI